MNSLMTFRLMCLALIAMTCPTLAQNKDAQDSKPAANKTDPAGAKKDGATPPPKGEQHSAADIEDWAKMAAPGEHHKKLDALVGKWNFTIKYSEDHGGGESKGTSEFTWALGGRFLVETTKTDMGGMPLEWMGWHGYDNQKKQYVSSWVDNFSTGIQNFNGRYDNASNTLTYTGEVDDPAGGKQNVKWQIQFEGKDKFTTTMIEGVGNGKERVAMKITATRG